MAKKVKEEVESDLDAVPRFKNKDKDELFWDMKGLKQCLWTMFEGNKFKALTEKQMQSAWEEFNKIEEFVFSKYEPKLMELYEAKENKTKVLEKQPEEITNLINAKDLNALKKAWMTIISSQHSRKELKYLTELKNKRKDELDKE
jgi:hypothetical protein